jgi:hypothetical protein
MLSKIYAICHIQALYIECYYAGCRYAECRGAILGACQTYYYYICL